MHITNHFTVIPQVKQKPPRTKVRTGMGKDFIVSVDIAASIKTFPSNVPWSILGLTVLRLMYVVWVLWYVGCWYLGIVVA